MSSGFITESEANEIRKQRQEEWEKVRKADDPLGQYTLILFFVQVTSHFQKDLRKHTIAEVYMIDFKSRNRNGIWNMKKHTS